MYCTVNPKLLGRQCTAYSVIEVFSGTWKVSGLAVSQLAVATSREDCFLSQFYSRKGETKRYEGSKCANLAGALK